MRVPPTRLRRTGAGVLFLLGLGVAVAWLPSVRGSILGSAHDLSGLHPGQRICVYCHTPHGADTSVIDAPLWNHRVTNRTFQLYDSPTLDATIDQPKGSSRLCLSCHDGSVAVDSFGGRSGSIFMNAPLAVAADTEQLSNDHPISFVYDNALAVRDGELFPPSSTPSSLGGTIAQDLLQHGRLECSSCHDVHNGPGASAVNDHLLVVTQVQSRLCLICHDK